MRTLFDGEVHVHYGQLYVASAPGFGRSAATCSGWPDSIAT